jgi:membrane protein implicated in regulation of membrane protease activity
MRPRRARLLFAAWLAAAAVFLTWPGALPFNRIRPYVLGLPFSLAWVVLWIVAGLVVFLVMDRALVREDARKPQRNGTERG